MHKHATRILGLMSTVVAGVLVATLALAAPAAPSASFTVGDFLLLYAKSAQLTLPPNATPQTALAVLQAAKLLPEAALALDRPITHGDVVRIGRASGLKIASSTPDRTIDRAEAEIFLDTFVEYAATASGSQTRIAASDNPPGDPMGHANTDKGKKKGRPFHSPSEPEP